MQQGLFCVMESKAEARDRAKKISEALSAIEDAPQEIEIREGWIGDLKYFMDKSAASALDPNDLDGLMRLGMDTAEILEDADIDEMHANAAIWKPLPECWPGAGLGSVYPCQLHRKEIEYLQEVIDENRAEMEAIKSGAEACKLELEELRAVGPLAPEDAKRFNLTVDGKRDRKIQQEGKHETLG